MSEYTNNPFDALMVVDCRELCEDDWIEFKEHMTKLKLRWKWIQNHDWSEK